MITDHFRRALFTFFLQQMMRKPVTMAQRMPERTSRKMSKVSFPSQSIVKLLQEELTFIQGNCLEY